MVKQWYLDHNYELLAVNRTIHGSEIDLIVQESQSLVFVEVKVVDAIEDTLEYISKAKCRALIRGIETYLMRYPNEREVRVDLVFVQQGEILEVIEDVSLYD